MTHFTCTSEKDYDRHHYKIISKDGESIVVDNWDQVNEIWWNKSSYLDHIEVLDKPQPKSRGFK